MFTCTSTIRCALRSRPRVLRAVFGLGYATLMVSPAVAAPAADYVFTNGAIYTVSEEQPWAEAVAVKGDRIVYVGSAKGAAEHIGKSTRKIDLAGGMLLPGFIDAHAHTSGFATLADADLADRTAPPEGIVERLRKFVESHPNEKLIRGSGWIYQTFGEAGPTKAMIDEIVPDRPAVLRSIDGHLMWVNSKTLELAGITADTPDPEPGVSWFQRLPGSREPSGFIVEGSAIGIVTSALEKLGYELNSAERLKEGYRLGLPIMSAAGVTAIFDAGISNEPVTYEILRKLEADGKLSIRLFGSHRYYADLPGSEQDDPVGDFLKMRQKYHSDLLSVAQIKVAIDGSEDNHTAFMLDPYADIPEFRGKPLLSPERLNDLLQKADANDVDVHMHVVGDAGARMALDAIEYAKDRNGSRDRRHTLTHAILIHPDDIARFRKLGAIWQTTPSWTSMSPRNIAIEKAMGSERFAERMYPLGDAINQGVIVNYSSDLGSLNPAYIFKPLDQIQIGHTRQPIDKPDFNVMPRISQRVSVADSIRAYTINGAYMLRMEKKIGSIEVGKFADLVVLDRNLFDVSPYDLHKAVIKMTMMNGTVTYGNRN